MNWPITFAQPIWLAALLLLPAVLIVYSIAEKQSQAKLNQLIAPKLQAVLLQGVHRGKRLAQLILTLIGLAGLIVALACPQFGFETMEVKRKGRDVVVAIDTSRSMLADDVSPNRLTRAKLAVQDLLRILEGDRIALVAFAGTAFLQAPLTIDYGAVQDSLEEIDTNIIPKGGTNLAEAIKVSLQAFGKAEGANKALVLFTDGEELDADALKAAKLAKEAGVRIFTVGVGSTAGTMIPIQENGSSTFVKDDSGQFVKTKLDEARLREIADAADGFYVHLENGSNAVQILLSDGIQKLEQREGNQFSSRRPIERYQWPLGLGIVFLVLAHSLSDRRRSALGAAVFLALVPTPQASAAEFKFFDQDKRAFNQGYEAYQNNKPDDALDLFSKASTSQNPEVRKKAEYNAANSLFVIGSNKLEKSRKDAIADWKEALAHYDESLKIDPKFEDAKTNRDIVEKLLKEDEKKKEEQEKRDEKDKQDQQDKKDQQKDQNQAKNDQNKDGKENQDQQQKDSDQKKDQGQPKDDKDGKSGKDGKNQPDQAPKSGQNQQQKDGENKSDPMPTPGEKKEGDLKTADEGEKKEEPKEDQIGQASEKPEEEKDGKMSQAQARALIEAMQGEEQRVNLRDQLNESPVAKDW